MAAETAVEIDETKSWIDSGSKAFLLLYGIGYFIESYFDSRYGVGYINPLRSKVGFTGIAFGIQVAACILLFKLEELANNSSTWVEVTKQTSGFTSKILRIPHIVTFVAECGLIAFVLISVFVGSVPQAIMAMGHSMHRVIGSLFHAQHTLASGGGSSPVVVAPVVSTLVRLRGPLMGLSFLLMAMGGIIIRFFRAPVFLCAAMTTVGGIALIFFSANEGDIAFAQLFIAYLLFVLLVRIAFTVTEKKMKDLSSRRRVLLFTIALILPILYAHSIYGNVSAQWGGAGESSVIVVFEREVPPFPLKSPVHMLEETDEGFYLVGGDQNNGPAVYVPRKDVREVQYSIGGK